MQELEPRSPLSPVQRQVFAAGLVIAGAVLGLAAWRSPRTVMILAGVMAAAWGAAVALRAGKRRAQLPGVLFPALLAAMAGLSGVWPVGPIVVGVVLTLPVAVWVSVRPGFAQGFYDRWLSAAEPMGWSFSGAVLAVTYYLVFTPIGLGMRVFGRDILHLRRDAGAGSYWTPRASDEDPKRYFQQF